MNQAMNRIFADTAPIDVVTGSQKQEPPALSPAPPSKGRFRDPAAPRN